MGVRCFVIWSSIYTSESWIFYVSFREIFFILQNKKGIQQKKSVYTNEKWLFFWLDYSGDISKELANVDILLDTEIAACVLFLHSDSMYERFLTIFMLCEIRAVIVWIFFHASLFEKSQVLSFHNLTEFLRKI